MQKIIWRLYQKISKNKSGGSNIFFKKRRARGRREMAKNPLKESLPWRNRSQSTDHKGKRKQKERNEKNPMAKSILCENKEETTKQEKLRRIRTFLVYAFKNKKEETKRKKKKHGSIKHILLFYASVSSALQNQEGANETTRKNEEEEEDAIKKNICIFRFERTRRGKRQMKK